MNGSSLFKKIRENMIKRLLMTDLSGKSLIKRAAGDLAHDQRIETLGQIMRQREALEFQEVRKVIALLSSERQYTFVVHP